MASRSHPDLRKSARLEAGARRLSEANDATHHDDDVPPLDPSNRSAETTETSLPTTPNPISLAGAFVPDIGRYFVSPNGDVVTGEGLSTIVPLLRNDARLSLAMENLLALHEKNKEPQWQEQWNYIFNLLGQSKTLVEGGQHAGEKRQFTIRLNGASLDMRDFYDPIRKRRVEDCDLHKWIVQLIRLKRPMGHQDGPARKKKAKMSRDSSPTRYQGASSASASKASGLDVSDTPTRQQLSSMGIRKPDFSATLEITGRSTHSIPADVGELKSAEEKMSDNREDALVKAAICKAIIYLIISNYICGTFMAFAIFGTSFSRLYLVDKDTIAVECSTTQSRFTSHSTNPEPVFKWLDNDRFAECLAQHLAIPGVSQDAAIEDRVSWRSLASLFSYRLEAIANLWAFRSDRATIERPSMNINAVINQLFPNTAVLDAEDEKSRKAMLKHAANLTTSQFQQMYDAKRDLKQHIKEDEVIHEESNHDSPPNITDDEGRDDVHQRDDEECLVDHVGPDLYDEKDNHDLEHDESVSHNEADARSYKPDELEEDLEIETTRGVEGHGHDDIDDYASLYEREEAQSAEYWDEPEFEFDLDEPGFPESPKLIEAESSSLPDIDSDYDELAHELGWFLQIMKASGIRVLPLKTPDFENLIGLGRLSQEVNNTLNTQQPSQTGDNDKYGFIYREAMMQGKSDAAEYPSSDEP